MKIIGFLLGLVVTVMLLILTLGYLFQKIADVSFSEYEYVVRQDYVYWYTNNFDELDGCIYFVSNYNTEVKWCEKYQVEANYWKNGSPTLKTIWFGY